MVREGQSSFINSARDLESEYRDKVDDNMAAAGGADGARKKIQRSYSNTHGHSQSMTRSQQNNSEGANYSLQEGASRNIDSHGGGQNSYPNAVVFPTNNKGDERTAALEIQGLK